MFLVPLRLPYWNELVLWKDWIWNFEMQFSGKIFLSWLLKHLIRLECNGKLLFSLNEMHRGEVSLLYKLNIVKKKKKQLS